MDQSPSFKLLWHLPPLPLLSPVPPLLWPCRYPSTGQQEAKQPTFNPHFIEDILGDKRDEKLPRYEYEGNIIFAIESNHDFHQDPFIQVRINTKEWAQKERMRRKKNYPTTFSVDQISELENNFVQKKYLTSAEGSGTSHCSRWGDIFIKGHFLSFLCPNNIDYNLGQSV